MKTSALLVTLIPIPAMAACLYVYAPALWTPLTTAGLLLVLASMALVTLARLQLGDSFSAAPQALALVTHGLYGRLRNPVYVFSFLLFLGAILYVNRPTWLLALAPLFAMQATRAKAEARVLEERFGDTYRAYRRATWF